jgi:hypothetical protein
VNEDNQPLSRKSNSIPPYHKYCFCNFQSNGLRETSRKSTRSPLRGHISSFNVDFGREYCSQTCRLDAQVFEILLKTGLNKRQANTRLQHGQQDKRMRGKQKILEMLHLKSG